MGYVCISPQQAFAVKQQGGVFVDIRDQQSYALSHVDSAIHLDNRSVADFLQNQPKDQPVVVYCYHGISSQSAAQFLSEQGFSECYSLNGGYEQWRLHYPETCQA